MAIRKLDRSTLAHFEKRLEKLLPDTQRAWGTLTPHALLAHLRFSLDLSLGLEHKPDKSMPGVRTAAYYLFFRLFTKWPQGKIKAPEYFMPPPMRRFHDEKSVVIEKMRQFVQALEEQPKTRFGTPYLGAITLRKWQYVHGAHLDHHLRQFGL